MKFTVEQQDLDTAIARCKQPESRLCDNCILAVAISRQYPVGVIVDGDTIQTGQILYLHNEKTRQVIEMFDSTFDAQNKHGDYRFQQLREMLPMEIELTEPFIDDNSGQEIPASWYDNMVPSSHYL